MTRGDDGHPDDAPDEAAVETAKNQLRREIRVRRRARDDRRAVEQGLVSTALGAPAVRTIVATSGTVALYASFPHEPGTGPLRAALRRGGVRVILPVVLTGSRLEWVEDDGLVAPDITPAEAVDPARALGPAALAAADLALVPALAVDLSGQRLGQGGGYYDRALARHRPALVVAVVNDDEVRERVPTGRYDRGVDGVLTPARWIGFSSGSAPV